MAAAKTAAERAESRADRAEGRAEARAERRRPDLAVVAPRRRITPTAVGLTLMAATLAFGALSVQISLIHRQQHLDGIRHEITETQLANKELRESESRLQAPAEILRIAKDELGMVQSRPPELVTPEGEAVTAADPTEAASAAPTTAPASDG